MVDEVNGLDIVHVGVKQIVQPIRWLEIIHEVHKKLAVDGNWVLQCFHAHTNVLK